MLRDTASDAEIEIGPLASWGSEQRSAPDPDWRRVDRALRAIRRRRATLDAEEARWRPGRAVVDAAAAALEPEVTLERLIFEGLEAAILCTQALAALTGLGAKPAMSLSRRGRSPLGRGSSVPAHFASLA